MEDSVPFDPGLIVRRSPAARRLRLTVHRDGRVVLTVPHRVSLAVAEQFVRDKQDWIARGRAKMAALPPLPTLSPAEYRRQKEIARQTLRPILERYAQAYGFRYTRLTIRNQKTCWGSCSRRGTISLNYRLAAMPVAIQEYVIVHELCHLAEMNHSPKFWARVARILPDYGTRRRQLRALARHGRFDQAEDQL